MDNINLSNVTIRNFYTSTNTTLDELRSGRWAKKEEEHYKKNGTKVLSRLLLLNTQKKSSGKKKGNIHIISLLHKKGEIYPFVRNIMGWDFLPQKIGDFLDSLFQLKKGNNITPERLREVPIQVMAVVNNGVDTSEQKAKIDEQLRGYKHHNINTDSIVATVDQVKKKVPEIQYQKTTTTVKPKKEDLNRDIINLSRAILANTYRDR